MLGIKQESLAYDLGEDWTQKKISLLEGKEEIEPAMRKRVADVMKVPVEAIENLDDDATINYINTFNDNSGQGALANNCTLNIDTAERWLEALGKIEQLTERLLQSEREKVDMLREMLQHMKDNK